MSHLQVCLAGDESYAMKLSPHQRLFLDANAILTD
jgi:hypothetical protein